MLGGAKLAGILLERSGDRVVAGFGVNLATAPQIEGRTAALTLAERSRRRPSRRCSRLASPGCSTSGVPSQPAAFARAWLARAHPLGTPPESSYEARTNGSPAPLPASSRMALCGSIVAGGRSRSSGPATSICVNSRELYLAACHGLVVRPASFRDRVDAFSAACASPIGPRRDHSAGPAGRHPWRGIRSP